MTKTKGACMRAPSSVRDEWGAACAPLGAVIP